jgi:hypothetical protein
MLVPACHCLIRCSAAGMASSPLSRWTAGCSTPKAACQHSKCRFLPELINTAADTLGSDAEAIKRFTALQQRFGFTLHQLREGCRAVCSPCEQAGDKLVPGSGVRVQQLAEALQQAGLLQGSGT